LSGSESRDFPNNPVIVKLCESPGIAGGLPVAY
jgi:hypothetical protein